MSYLAERFEAALLALIGDGPIKQRLNAAYSEHLEDLEEAELPAALRGAFSELNAALNRVAPIGKETRVKASVQKMSFREAGAHAATIVELYSELIRQGQRSKPLKVVKSLRDSTRERSAAGGS
jgi:hypothetical protein